MDHEDSMNIIIAVGSLVTLPWTVWVTVSIFSQRTQIELLKKEIQLLDRIHLLLEGRA